MFPLKIMYLNPVGSDTYDQLFADMITTYKYPNTEAHVTSLNPSVGNITNLEYRTYEAVVTADIVRAARQAAIEGFDAMVIACFYDTALHDAREISGNMVVVAPCQSSVHVALTLANNFSIIVGQQKWVHQMQSTIHGYGYTEKLKSFLAINMSVVEFQKDHECTHSRLVKAGRKAVSKHYAESIILGCTLETGYYKELEEELGVPVIDPSLASFKAAEHAALLKKEFGWKPSRKWGSLAPPENELQEFGLFSKPYEFGNRVIISGG